MCEFVINLTTLRLVGYCFLGVFFFGFPFQCANNIKLIHRAKNCIRTSRLIYLEYSLIMT